MSERLLDNELLASIRKFQTGNPDATIDDMKEYWKRGKLLNEIGEMPVFNNEKVGLYQNSEVQTEIVRTERERYTDKSTFEKQFE